MAEVIGNVRKMLTALDQPVSYHWLAGDQQVGLNDALGKTIQIRFLGSINCVHCNRVTKKVSIRAIAILVCSGWPSAIAVL